MHDLERRRLAVEKTMVRFVGRPHAFGTIDCVRVGAAHVRNMGHHVALGLAKAGSYRSRVSAARALARAGFTRPSDALQRAGFVPIGAASALPGDLLVVPSSDGLDAISIYLDNMATLGFHDDALEEGLLPIRLDSFDGVEAWRL